MVVRRTPASPSLTLDVAKEREEQQAMEKKDGGAVGLERVGEPGSKRIHFGPTVVCVE